MFLINSQQLQKRYHRAGTAAAEALQKIDLC